MLSLILLQTVDSDTCDAIALLYRKYERLMFKVALEWARSEEDAEDAVHDAFLWLIKAGRVPDLDDPKAKGILTCVAKEKAIDIYRKNRVRSTEPLEAADKQAQTEDPDAVLMAKEAIAKLPEDLRSTLILSVYGGFTTSEIAELQGVKQNTVQKRLKKAKEKIRIMLSENDQK